MGGHLVHWYDHVMYVSRYPVLTAVKNFLTTTGMCNIRLPAPTLARSVIFYIGLPVVLTDVWSPDHQNFLRSWIDNQISSATCMGAPRVQASREHGAPLNNFIIFIWYQGLFETNVSALPTNKHILLAVEYMKWSSNMQTSCIEMSRKCLVSA